MIEKQLNKNRNNNVLIVDDADENLKFLSEILIADGYSVSQASSGEQAIMMIKAQLPGIILLDVMMPEMDGFEVCRQLKADPETTTIPVIFISALGDEQSKLQGFQVGGVDYITKPFRKVEILARVRVHINLRNFVSDLETQKERLVEEALILIRDKQRLLGLAENIKKMATPLATNDIVQVIASLI